jgi:dATP pyrophosphohydrolase
MARAKYQVLVIPFYIEEGVIQYCIFRRSDRDIWQFIAGGGEDEDSSIIESAKREAFEEGRISADSDYYRLDSCCSIPAICFKDAETVWGRDCFVIPEYAFGVKIEDKSLSLSHEHTSYK